MTATTRAAQRQKTPNLVEELRNGDANVVGERTSPGSTESSQDDGEKPERPVRRRLKKATIAGPDDAGHEGTASEHEDTTPNPETQANGAAHDSATRTTNGVEPRGRVQRKRSFEDTGDDDSQETSTRTASKHIRKRSREGIKSKEMLQNMDEEPLTDGITPKDAVTADQDPGANALTNDEQGDRETGSLKHASSDAAEPPQASGSALRNKRHSTPDLPLPAAGPVADDALASPGVKRMRDQFIEEEVAVTEEGPDKSTNISKINATIEPTSKRHHDTLSTGIEKISETADPKISVASGFANTSLLSPFATIAEKSSGESGQLGTSTDTSSKSPFASLSAKPVTSASAFAASGFAALAGSAQSPFATFGSANAAKSNGNAIQKDDGDAAPASGFGGLSAASASPFATAGPSAFGGKSSFGGFGGGFGGVPGGLGNGFGGVPGSLGSTGFGGALGAPLKSFASPAPAFGAAAKTFGAAADEDDEEGEVADEEDAEKGLGAEDERVKDSRFYEQDVETGEEHETTVFQSRAKLYVIADKQWKERGVGNFKINVTKEAEKRTARFLMRADGVHRIVLNSPISKTLEVKDPLGGPPKGKTALFIGSVDGKPVTCQLKFRSNVQSSDLYDAVSEIQADM